MARKPIPSPERPEADNPFAALRQLSDLPPPPDDLPEGTEEDNDDGNGSDTSAPIRILLDRKQRRGKEATIVTGFVGPEDELAALGKRLTVSCGVGGTVKQGEIILQGNHRDRVLDELTSLGYRNVKLSGG